MRTLSLVIVAAVLGTCVGVGTTWARLGRAPDFSSEFDLLTSANRSSTGCAGGRARRPAAGQ